MENSKYHETWSSRTAFLLAAVGAAVGLGNIWRFPYLAGEYGGSAFVLVYILCIVAVGIPILIAELMMGRRGRMSPIGTMTVLAKEAGASRHWRKAGWLAVVTIFLAGTFYYVVASWVLAYVLLAIEGAFAGIDSNGTHDLFTALMNDPLRLALWFAIFMAMTVFVVASGIRDGLERAVKFLMPSLFVLLVIMVAYAAYAGDFVRGWNFLFRFDASKITPQLTDKLHDLVIVIAIVERAVHRDNKAMALWHGFAQFSPPGARFGGVMPQLGDAAIRGQRKTCLLGIVGAIAALELDELLSVIGDDGFTVAFIAVVVKANPHQLRLDPIERVDESAELEVSERIVGRE